MNVEQVIRANADLTMYLLAQTAVDDVFLRSLLATHPAPPDVLRAWEVLKPGLLDGFMEDFPQFETNETYRRVLLKLFAKREGILRSAAQSAPGSR